VQLAAVLDGASARIVVRDQGIGMLGSDLARASERFFRAESSRHTPGSGLGLSLVQAVAQLHGGRLELGTPDRPIATASPAGASDAAAKPGLEAALVLPLNGMAPLPGRTSSATSARMEPASSLDHDLDRPA
jgi:signal transduction histidine kinase